VENKIRTRFVRPQCSVGYHGSVGYILETAIKKKEGKGKEKKGSTDHLPVSWWTRQMLPLEHLR